MVLSTAFILSTVSPFKPSPLASSLTPRRPQIYLSAATPRSPSPSLSTTPPSQTFPQPPVTPPSHIPLTLLNYQCSISGRHLLTIVPLLWASFIACAKLLYILPCALSPASFNAARLAVSSLFFLPTLLPELVSFLRRPNRNHSSAPTLKSSPGIPLFLSAGVELGLLMFCGNLAQIAGLKYTEASRAAFLNQLSTVLVPLAAATTGAEPLTTRVSTGAVCAFLGVGLLTMGSSKVVKTLAFPWMGDLLEVLAAGFFTLYVLRMSRHAKRVSGKAGTLVAVKVVTQAILSMLWLSGGWLLKKWHGLNSGVVGAVVGAGVGKWTTLGVLSNVGLVLWAGVLVGAGTSWMQAKGQGVVSAGEAAILYAAQPLWASVIAGLMLGERMGRMGIAGAALIVTGTLVSGWKGKGKAG